MLTFWIVCSIINIIALLIIFRNERLVYGHIFLYVTAVIVAPLLTLTFFVMGVVLFISSGILDTPVFKDKE